MEFLKREALWALKYFGFLVSVAVVGSVAIVFLAYPLQFVLSAVALFTVYVLFVFFSEV